MRSYSTLTIVDISISCLSQRLIIFLLVLVHFQFSAPEILLGETSYSTAVDMWSVGCIFGELILNEPIFQAKGEMELIAMVCIIYSTRLSPLPIDFGVLIYWL